MVKDMLIGLTGTMGSGKGEVVRVLEKLGFQYLTLSQMVREEAKRQGIPEERERFQDLGNAMRAQGGLGVLAKKALEKIGTEGGDRWMVDGIRNPAEIDELRKKGSVHIVGVTTDRDTAVLRILQRGRPSDPKTREEVLQRIEREWEEKGKPEGQQVGLCVKKADRVLNNSGTLEEFVRRVENWVMELELSPSTGDSSK